MASEIEINQYHDNLLDLFASKGWKSMLEDFTERLEFLIQTAATDCVDNTSWQIRRGQINELDKLVNYETFIRASIEAKEQPDEAFYGGLH